MVSDISLIVLSTVAGLTTFCMLFAAYHLTQASKSIDKSVRSLATIIKSIHAAHQLKMKVDNELADTVERAAVEFSEAVCSTCGHVHNDSRN